MLKKTSHIIETKLKWSGSSWPQLCDEMPIPGVPGQDIPKHRGCHCIWQQCLELGTPWPGCLCNDRFSFKCPAGSFYLHRHLCLNFSCALTPVHKMQCKPQNTLTYSNRNTISEQYWCKFSVAPVISAQRWVSALYSTPKAWLKTPCTALQLHWLGHRWWTITAYIRVHSLPGIWCMVSFLNLDFILHHDIWTCRFTNQAPALLFKEPSMLLVKTWLSICYI